ncbi:MAG: hypothetical protein KC492_44230, partial [Myxococcales bacterium]|nr:hypothetical protein [Myxococcales bacterium]
VFWIDVSGLDGLYDTLVAWGDGVLDALKGQGLRALLAIGFSRFGSYAALKALLDARARTSQPSLRVMTSPAGERSLAMQVPLTYLQLSPHVLERLLRLDIHTLGELMALPEAGVMKRWGSEALALHRLASGLAAEQGDLFSPFDQPLRPQAEFIPAHAHVILDFLEHDAHRLLFRIKALLETLLPLVRQRLSLIAVLHLRLTLDRQETPTLHHIRPAAATLDSALLLDLVRLRLEHIDLQRGVVEVHLEAAETPADPEQIRIFKLGPHQDGAAAARALARVQAELGEAAVGTLSLRDAHLPRARQAFVPLRFGPRHKVLATPHPSTSDGAPPLIRRLHPRPRQLPPQPRDMRNDGWQPHDPTQGTIVAIHGPFV